MTRSLKKKIILAGVLLALLLGLLLYFLYYNSTKKLGFDITPVANETLRTPEFLFAFNGNEGNRLQNPVGVLAESGKVYVSDTRKAVIDVFDVDGKYLSSIGASETVTPLYMDINPKDGNLYVSDRRLRTILIFDTDGKKVGEFKPDLPKKELPDLKTTGGVVWVPMALTFDEQGNLYVTDFLKGHRLLIFNQDGSFKKSVGYAAIANDRSEGEGAFQFPSSVKVQGDEVFVADSNNGRIQVFDKEGVFKRFIVTKGLPRGIDFLDPFKSDKEDAPIRLVTMDTLAHDGTIWTSEGKDLVGFGTNGVLEGQFSYPEDMSVGIKNRMYIADTRNGRVQVWGWPEEVSPIPVPRVPQNWGYCLIPMLLLPFLLLLRKRKVFVTDEFIGVAMANGDTAMFTNNKVRWIVLEETYEKYRDVDLTDDGPALGKILVPTPFSESDVSSLMKKYEIGEPLAIRLAVAQRVKVFASVDADERKYARLMEIDVVDEAEAVDRYTPKSKTTKKVKNHVDS